MSLRVVFARTVRVMAMVGASCRQLVASDFSSASGASCTVCATIFIAPLDSTVHGLREQRKLIVREIVIGLAAFLFAFFPPHFDNANLREQRASLIKE